MSESRADKKLRQSVEDGHEARRLLEGSDMSAEETEVCVNLRRGLCQSMREMDAAMEAIARALLFARQELGGRYDKLFEIPGLLPFDRTVADFFTEQSPASPS